MDMHIPHALLQVAQEPRPYRIADRPDYFFSEQLSATYEAANHALWIRWTPARARASTPKCCARWTGALNSSAPATGSSAPGGRRAATATAQAHADRIHGAVLRRAGRVQPGRRSRSVPAPDRSQGPRRPGRVRHRLHSRSVPELLRARPAHHHHLAGPGRLPRRRVRGRAVERHRGRRKACPLRLPRDHVQSVPGHGRLFLPGPAGRPARHGRASFDWKNLLGR